MEESILHMQLMNRPVVSQSEGEHNVDRGWLHDRNEGLIEIHAKLLEKPCPAHLAL